MQDNACMVQKYRYVLMRTLSSFLQFLCVSTGQLRGELRPLCFRTTAPLWTNQMAHPQTDTPAREQIKRDERYRREQLKLQEQQIKQQEKYRREELKRQEEQDRRDQNNGRDHGKKEGWWKNGKR